MAGQQTRPSLLEVRDWWEGEATGSTRESGKQRQVTRAPPNPVHPENRPGNQGSEAGRYIPEVTQQGWEEGEGSVRSADLGKPAFPASPAWNAGTGGAEQGGPQCPGAGPRARGQGRRAGVGRLQTL